MDRRSRAALCDLSARIMVESGVDWLAARTKAARSMGVNPGQARQIEQAEIHQALRTHQLLFSLDAEATLHRLRQAALQAMQLLAEFEPELIGPVAEGVVTPHTPIEIQLWTQSEKDLELRLLNARVAYRVESSRDGRTIKYRCDQTDPIVLITANIRMAGGRAGRNRSSPEALSLRDLEAILAQSDA